MKEKSSAWNDFLKPILVLVCICFVVTFALAGTYGVTKPIIDANTLAAANEARNELLPEANSDFEEYTGDLFILEENKVYVTEVYKAGNGTGMVVTVKSSSYGGLLTAMVGINADGAVTSVKITEHADTPGVGTKAQADSHLGQYGNVAELTSPEVKKDNVITHVTGASVSSGAIHKAVYAALEQYKSMGGVN
ncbi:MAG: FMN-binding protein [Mogibacterium sp.]|nr:FMN-binding protein [Mogibacterium sp.]